MSSPTRICIVDDQLVSTVAIVADRLGRADRAEEFEIVGFDTSRFRSAAEFAAEFTEFLDQNTDLRLVFVDMWMGPFSGLTALRILAERVEAGRAGPYAVGLCDPNEDRVLFKFAAVQMFAPATRPLVGWFDKSVDSIDESLELLQMVRAGGPVLSSPALKECDSAELRSLMHELLRNRYDVMIWKFLSLGGYAFDEIAIEASVSKAAVNLRLSEYRDAIDRYRAIVGPRYGAAGYQVGDAGQRLAAVAAFAALHKIFFMTPDLEDLVHRYQDHPDRNRRNRMRRG